MGRYTSVYFPPTAGRNGGGEGADTSPLTPPFPSIPPIFHLPFCISPSISPFSYLPSPHLPLCTFYTFHSHLNLTSHFQFSSSSHNPAPTSTSLLFQAFHLPSPSPPLACTPSPQHETPRPLRTSLTDNATQNQIQGQIKTF